jgi:Outer membrane protein LpxR
MRLAVYMCAMLLLVCARPGSADQLSTSSDGARGPSTCQRTIAGVEEVTPSEPSGVGAGIVLDEHLLTNGSRDQDYNGGGEFTFSGEHTGPIGRVLDRALGFVDEKTCPGSRFAAPGWQLGHAFSLGLIVFSPRNLTAHEVVTGDRPYASLFFLSAGRRYVSADTDVAYNSSLTVGMMGLAAAGSVQHALHSLTGSVQPQGWSHQVSAGGEPTIRYSTARQALLREYGEGPLHGDSKWTVAGSVGTVTEASLAFNARWGRIESPWWAFTPEQTMYVQDTQPIPPPLGLDAPPEIFVFAGARAKLRVYDAFLQGQFRHSDLSYGEGDLNPMLGEAWVGVEMRTSSGWALQYLARWESPELVSGPGSRSFMWGSIEVTKTFR